MAAGSTYTPIGTTTLGSAAASITFSSLGSYTDIFLVGQFGNTSGGTTVGLRFNSDSGTNYSTTQMNGPMPFGSSWRGSNQTSISVFGSPIVSGTSGNLIDFGSVAIQNYSNNTTYKTVISRNGWATGEVIAGVGLWRNTAAITSITLLASGTTFLTGTTFSIYGIAAA